MLHEKLYIKPAPSYDNGRFWANILIWLMGDSFYLIVPGAADARLSGASVPGKAHARILSWQASLNMYSSAPPPCQSQVLTQLKEKQTIGR